MRTRVRPISIRVTKDVRGIPPGTVCTDCRFLDQSAPVVIADHRIAIGECLLYGAKLEYLTGLDNRPVLAGKRAEPVVKKCNDCKRDTKTTLGRIEAAIKGELGGRRPYTDG